jgi:AbrB family looped-hinge helix DNA binding protein
MPRSSSRLTTKAQTTIPKPVRKALGLNAGDVVVYDIEEGRVTLRKARSSDTAWLKGLQSTLDEWASPEDAAAYDNL